MVLWENIVIFVNFLDLLCVFSNFGVVYLTKLSK